MNIAIGLMAQGEVAIGFMFQPILVFSASMLLLTIAVCKIWQMFQRKKTIKHDLGY